MKNLHIKIRDLNKRYGNTDAVKDFNLEVERGNFTTLLGPSGCGKTTTLRIIAGFVKEDSGKIFINDQLINDLPAHKRKVGMVFQSYALFPHMNVFNNLAYGLYLKKIPRKEIEERVKNILRFIGLEGKEDQMISQLSGGQQQRVALGRTIILEPEVLLMDEPLSNLDAKLRISVRNEIKQIQKKLNITTIYVTHDQEEALSMSDTVVVMEAGRIQQIGTPREIYNSPRNKFVADFIGTKNFLEVVIERVEKEKILVKANQNKLLMNKVEGVEFSSGEKILVSIRPEDIKIHKHKPEKSVFNLWRGIISQNSYLGKIIRYWIQTPDGQEIIVEDYAPKEFLEGEVYLEIDEDNIQYIQKE